MPFQYPRVHWYSNFDLEKMWHRFWLQVYHRWSFPHQHSYIWVCSWYFILFDDKMIIYQFYEYCSASRLRSVQSMLDDVDGQKNGHSSGIDAVLAISGIVLILFYVKMAACCFKASAVSISFTEKYWGKVKWHHRIDFHRENTPIYMYENVLWKLSYKTNHVIFFF